ncbi:hypothetical protein DAETH_39470 (plasmid) [Deinococcus aetherius]|uniref:ZU5 domain-containing protein n=1 Tax=Deinococcus aetherius TaxID=200252 RepID=A0ABN6RKX3_9DEIO|nr:hypothetical protein [Deinococcus aetherius]BDP43978.1 hypothetical protein DAETH_39470 [Deinococcus aetherius]
MRTLTALLLGSALLLGACTTTPSTDPPPSTQPPGPSQPVPPSPVGTPVGSPVTAVIGAAGGQLQLPGGSVRIDIPAGALSGDQTVGIQEMTNTAAGGVGRAYRLTPEGTTFAKPVRLTFGYTEEEVVGTAPEALSLGYQDEGGVWRMYRRPTRDPAARTVSVETNHFSTWSMLAGLQLLPHQAKVRVGQIVNLSVVDCTDGTELDPDALTVPMPGGDNYECAPAAIAFTAKNWSVNGAAGGNSSLGTVASGGISGTGVYTAPARKPAQNPVAVSTQVTDLYGQTFTLVSNVTVEDGQAWQGTVTYTETGSRPWVMRDGFEGSGLEKTTQTHTFKVVGVREQDAYNTILLLEQDALAAYEDRGHMEKKIYEICQAFGPKILRHHFIYDRNFYMGGSLKTTIEARLNMSNGRYSLAIIPKDVEMTGQDVTVDIYKDGCAGTTNDRSNNKAMKYPVGPENLRVEGNVDSAHPGTLTGGYEGKGEIFVQPTTYTVSWNLTRAP